MSSAAMDAKLSLAGMVSIEETSWKSPVKIMRYSLCHAVCSCSRKEILPVVRLVEGKGLMCPVWFSEYEHSPEATDPDRLLKAFRSGSVLRCILIPFCDVMIYNKNLPNPILSFSRFHTPSFVCKVAILKAEAIKKSAMSKPDSLEAVALLPMSLRKELCLN